MPFNYYIEYYSKLWWHISWVIYLGHVTMEFSTTFVSGFVIFGLNKKIGPYVRVCMCKVCAEFFGGIFKNSDKHESWKLVKLWLIPFLIKQEDCIPISSPAIN